MRRSFSWLAILVFVSTLALAGCGDDRGDRGLTPPDEVETPDSTKADAETAEQRKQRLDEEMQQDEIHEFDSANDAKDSSE